MRLITVLLLASTSLPAHAVTLVADPAASASDADYYRTLVDQLGPGDTLQLPAGTYGDRLNVSGLQGDPDAWITITGPTSGAPAIITTSSTCCNNVQLGNTWYVALKNLTIDSAGIDAIDGINAKDGLTHDILLENCDIVGQDSGQQTVGISTKSPAWNWTLRGNRIIHAGTGAYLGNSTGDSPFIAGVIEGNLFVDTIGYNMQIKHQNPYGGDTWVAELPAGPHRTIIRNNVFLKRIVWPSGVTSGPRPNLLVGTFPDSGTGSNDRYEIYGNFFFDNQEESLIQATGRVSIHDNVFVNDDPAQNAVYIVDHNGPIRVAHIYNNTIYAKYRGINFASQPRDDHAVVGNLIFSDTPIRQVTVQADNVTDTFENAAAYVNAPNTTLGSMDFYPRADCTACAGAALDLSPFADQTNYDRDFNGTHKGDFTVRGAYAGVGTNPGWQLDEENKVGGPSGDDVAPAAPSNLDVQ